MQNRSAIVILFLIIVSNMALSRALQKKAGWRLVWNDEFNYSGLPDARKWGYETGHIRNQEQQYYTHARKENVWVDNGVLIITGKKEKYKNEFYKKGDNNWRYSNPYSQYTSASINTDGLAGWRYGRIEIKAKLPKGAGMWPAIWMMGTNRKRVGFPACGEIDIMEFIGKQPTEIYGTIHFADEKNKLHSISKKVNNATLTKDFHMYAIEWNKDVIDIYFDDIKFHTFAIDSAGTGRKNPFRKPFYLIINLAMGAGWPGPIDDSVLPQQFIIDHVRVYKKIK